LRNPDVTLEIIKRTEHAETAKNQDEIIRRELAFIDNWLEHWAPDEVKFSLAEQIEKDAFTENEAKLFARLAEKIAAAPADADGAWFHNAMYEQKDELGMQPKEMFSALYRLIIGKTSGPRAGWFLSILPRDWLLHRLKLES
ncbi:MAG: lysyl-tRNA synthetase, class, partial [Patescibacteria group bacterium]|nr:lysyl-tRNA synthetase, class [Patescibacteria group bacterium]